MKPVLDLEREYGVVLEGGGAKGAYQIGVWKALREAGVNIKGISGTSVGAINGALMCMGDLKKAEHIWENISYSKIMDVDDTLMKEFFDGILTLRETVNLFFQKVKEGGMDITPLKKLIEDSIDVNEISHSPVEFYLKTFSLDEMKELDVDVRQLDPALIPDMLLASAYIFPVFKNEKLHGKTYMDGGIIDNVPLDCLVKREYKDILLIRIFGIGRYKPVKIPDGTTVTTIEPRVDLGNIIDFDSEKSKRNMVIGYFDGLRAVYGLGGRIYYLDEQEEETDYLMYLASLRNEKESLRKFIEKELPKIASELRLTDWDYRELCLSVLEATAKLCRVPKYRVYTVKDLLREIKKRVETLENTESFPDFAQRVINVTVSSNL